MHSFLDKKRSNLLLTNLGSVERVLEDDNKERNNGGGGEDEKHRRNQGGKEGERGRYYRMRERENVVSQVEGV